VELYYNAFHKGKEREPRRTNTRNDVAVAAAVVAVPVAAY
jgi:hypothetical protein